MITSRTFGSLKDGTEVTEYTITNSNGEFAMFLDYGATVHGIYVKDRNGELGNCVLQVSSPDELEKNNMAGSVIGRFANRIRYGRCTINGRELQLETNQGKHFLHGAGGNYAHRMFSGKIAGEQTLEFTLIDNGGGGFTDTVEVKVTYQFDDEDCLTITYDMTPEAATVLCPTNHSYFNLGGLSDIREHRLQLGSSYITETEDGIPNGGLVPVAGTVYDFTKERRIMDAMLEDREGRLKATHNGYDSFFWFEGDGLREKARLICPESGRSMTVYSDMEGVILYTPGNCRGKSSGGEEINVDYAAVCLETQFIPNSVNCPQFRSPVFQAGETLHSVTKYRFATIS